MADDYNVSSFPFAPTGYGNVDFQPDLRVGMEAPDFELTDLLGGRVRLSEEAAKRHAVLLFGCITSPVTATHLPQINRMWEYFHWRGVQFFFIYTREIHPGERYPHHTSFEQKLAAARELQRIEEIRFRCWWTASMDTSTARTGRGPTPRSSSAGTAAWSTERRPSTRPHSTST